MDPSLLPLRGRGVLAVMLLMACTKHPRVGPGDAGSPAVRQWPPDRHGYSNPVLAENAQPGTLKWNQLRQKATGGQIEGYADHVSAAAGDDVQLMVNVDSPHSFTWQLFRIGWYGGAGGRSITSGGPVSAGPQPACPIQPGTGLIQCSWAPAVQFKVTSDLVSGLFLFKLIRDDGFSSWIPLVIRDGRPADLLFQSSVLTAQAYNDWHGESLYDNNNPSIVSLEHAVEVSFDRPYVEGVGAGQMLQYELYMAQFLEHFGYDVTYTTNLDVAQGGEAMLSHTGAFLSVGHDEYWPKAERDALEAARDAGVPLLFFGANTGYWQVRLTDDSGTGAGPREVIGWKELWWWDPDQGSEVTAEYRNPVIDRPENALVGVMYNAWENVRAPLTIVDDSSWLFDGTGLRNGDTIPWLVGYESDSRFNNGFEPAGLRVAAQVPVVSVDGTVETASTVSYVASSGARVFATGSIEWSLGLGASGVADPRVERMTANALHEALGLSIPAGVGGAPPPAPVILGTSASRVDTLARNLPGVMSMAALPDGTIVAVDTEHNQILQLGSPPYGKVTVLAGTGTAGNAGWEAPLAGPEAELSRPTAVLVDTDGSLLIADTGNHCLRQIRNDASRSVVTIAGQCGTPGMQDATGTAALFYDPMGLTLDPLSGDILVADSWNGRIRAVQHDTWATSTVVGIALGNVNGPAAIAELDFPTAVAADPDDNLYVSESGSLTVARVGIDPDRTVTRLAGGLECGDDGPGNVACFGSQLGLVWTAGALYLADGANGRVRRIDPGLGVDDTQVSTFAGSGSGERDGTGSAAQFLLPFGLFVEPGGTLLVADYGAGTLRRITP